MAQPSPYALDFAGPFLGLNTVQAPHMLAPGFATVAENVLITRAGGVRPRDPWREYDSTGFSGGFPMVTGMLHLDVDKLAGSTYDKPTLRVLLKTAMPPPAIAGRLFQTSGFSGYSELAGPQPLSDAPPTWVLANRRLYVIDGSPRMIQYDGNTIRTIGIEPLSVFYHPTDDPPGNENVLFERYTGGPPRPDVGYYYYSASAYDSVYGIESNVSDWTSSVFHNGTTRMRVTIYPYTFNWPNRAIDTVRIYRHHHADEDGNALANPPRLIAELTGFDPNAPQHIWDNEVPDDEVTVSDIVTGPFPPTRNGPPPRARIAVWYKDRMWYADPDDGTRLWYSELSFPEHVGSTSFIAIGGDPDDVVTGMVEMAGQIIILKKDSIWILSGDLNTYDNSSVALALVAGVGFAESFPEVYKSKSKTGCHNSGGGNGAIVCGHPPLLYYSNANGLFRFDGVDDRPVSDWIMDEWAEVLNAPQGIFETDHSISYAVDLANEVLYVCPVAVRTGNPFPQRILCYHWRVDRGDGVGVWTTITNIGEALPPVNAPYLERLGIACIATCLGAPALVDGERVGHVSPLLVAGLYWYTPPEGEPTYFCELRYAELGASEEPTPLWRWRTGDLMLVAGGHKAHMYYLMYRHERATPEVGGGPTVKVIYAVDGKDPTGLGPAAGQDTRGTFMRRLHLGRTGRSLALEFLRGNETPWEPWNGLTGFAVDVELAEQR